MTVTGPGAEQQALIQYVLQHVLPEWSISEQDFQPTDIGNQASQTNILQDQLDLISNPLMSILNGTFDYSLLDPVGASTPPPETPNLTFYGGNEQYSGVIQSLEGGASVDEAARLAWALEYGITGDDVYKTKATDDPRLKNYIDVAGQLQPEVASRKQWESQAQTTEASATTKLLEGMGLPTGQTPDSYFSDSIEEDRAHASKSGEIEARRRARQTALAEIYGPGKENPFLAPEPESRGPIQQVGEREPLNVEMPWSSSIPGLAGQIAEFDFLRDAVPDAVSGGRNAVQFAKNALSGIFGGDGTNISESEYQRELRRNAWRAEPGEPGPYEHTRMPMTEEGRGAGGGDPRKPGTRNYDISEWERGQKQYLADQGRRLTVGHSSRWGDVAANNKLNQEEREIERERASGRSIQQDAALKLLLNLPR